MPDDQSATAISILLNTIQRATERTGLSRSKIYEKIASGELEAVKVDGRTYLPEVGIQAYIAKLPRVTPFRKNAA